ncbi:hypothetical protein C0991_007458 [Blastosporella zonata]|nr:hypothetical protein C0991_007458 [Blastosporella zonata]
MASTKAQADKEKGNAAFKAGDYPNAIGHYSAAILADGKDFTFPLNRAAAYLRLGKNEDAERDCTTVLRLNALNAKALFRRGQARLAMGKLEEASTDLTQALKREPANTAIKEELKKATELLEKQKAQVFRPTNALPPSMPAPKRRRVPIKIVDTTQAGPAVVSAPEPPKTTSSIKKAQVKSLPPESIPTASHTNGIDTLKPVSSRSLKLEDSAPTPPKPSSPAPAPAPAPAATPHLQPASEPETPRTFKDAKQARENVKTSHVGGGIFRASGESTLFPTRSYTTSPAEDKSQSTPAPAPISAPVTLIIPEKPPKTLFDFTRAWDTEATTAARWGLVLSIPPSSLPALFKISLEPAQLISVLSVFQEVLNGPGSDRQTVRGYMDAFGEVERFGTVVLFLNRAEKKVARGVWETLGVAKGDVARVWNPVWG